MTRAAAVVVVLFGCATHASSTSDSDEPAFTGDPCAAFTTASSCQSDTACMWFGTGCACPPNDPSCVCSPGTCASIDGSNAAAGCACSDGGVCYEQLGGPAEPANIQIECIEPSTGSGDACARITGQGTCGDSTSIAGLCICDNGER